MAKFIITATSSPKEGQDDDYNVWYDDVHIRDLLAIPGVVSGRRFVSSSASLFPPPSRYFAVYELSVDDPATVMEELIKRGANGQMVQSDSIDPAFSQLWVWEEISSVD